MEGYNKSNHSNHSNHARQSTSTTKPKGMSTEALQALCFPGSFSLESALVDESSTVVSEDETEKTSNENKTFSSGIHTSLSLQELQGLSIDANSKVSKECTAREGRAQQRWAVDPHNGRFMRLVAGCVPILNGGRILLISSNKGKGWLVPKGGWELDECLEEGAIRECFEEAGVLGVLGPQFDAFCVETKKARKLRIGIEEKLRQRLEKPVEESDLYSGWSVFSKLSEEDHLTDETSCNPTPTQTVVSPAREDIRPGVGVTFQLSDNERGKISCNLDQLVPKVDVIKSDTTEETASPSSLTHTHTSMTFFPLYVQKIHESWPENQRLRRAFDIDEAIQIIRPEFRPILEKTKEKGLHLIRGYAYR